MNVEGTLHRIMLFIYSWMISLVIAHAVKICVIDYFKFVNIKSKNVDHFTQCQLNCQPECTGNCSSKGNGY